MRAGTAQGDAKGKAPNTKVNMPLRSYHSHMFVVLLFTILQILVCTTLLLSSHLAVAQMQLADQTQSDASPALVVGFVGGFVHRDDLRHAEVQIAQQIQTTYGNGVHVQIFENRRTANAHKLILDWLNREGNGRHADEENKAPVSSCSAIAGALRPWSLSPANCSAMASLSP